jgi:hypothetical protein
VVLAAVLSPHGRVMRITRVREILDTSRTLRNPGA